MGIVDDEEKFAHRDLRDDVVGDRDTLLGATRLELRDLMTNASIELEEEARLPGAAGARDDRNARSGRGGEVDELLKRSLLSD